MDVYSGKVLRRSINVTVAAALFVAAVAPATGWAQPDRSLRGKSQSGVSVDALAHGSTVADVASPATSAAAAQTGSGVIARVNRDRPPVSIRRIATPPRIDGRLDDAAWQTAARVTEFVQQWPVEGAPASERTEVYLAYDDKNIYVGVYAHYANPRLIRANRVSRDRTVRDDTVILYLDPFLDEQRAYAFAVNGYGIQADGTLIEASTSSGGT